MKDKNIKETKESREIQKEIIKEKTKQKKVQKKVDLMIQEIMGTDPIPIIFNPYRNAGDCMTLWDKFSLGRSVEICSYSVSNDWVAKRNNTRHELDLEISAEGNSMLEAMCECMFKASRKDSRNRLKGIKRNSLTI